MKNGDKKPHPVPCPLCHRTIPLSDIDIKKDAAHCRYCCNTYSYAKSAWLLNCIAILKKPVPKRLKVTRTSSPSGPALRIRYSHVSGFGRFLAMLIFPLLLVGAGACFVLGSEHVEIKYVGYYGFFGGMVICLLLALFVSALRKTYNFKFTSQDLSFWITTPFRRKEMTWPISSDLSIVLARKDDDSSMIIKGIKNKSGMKLEDLDFSMDDESFLYMFAYFETWKPHTAEELRPVVKFWGSGFLNGLLEFGVISLKLVSRVGFRLFNIDFD